MRNHWIGRHARRGLAFARITIVNAAVEPLETRRLFAAAPAAVNDAFTTLENKPLVVPPGVSSLYLSGNSYVYSGTHTWGQADGTFTAAEPYARTDHNGVTVSFTGNNYPTAGSDDWTLDFAAPAGQALAAGKTYAGAQRFPFETGVNPGLDVYGDGRGSNTVAGQFTVLNVAFNANGSVASFAASFKHFHDGSASQELDGTVYYQYAPAGFQSGVLANDTAAAGVTLAAHLVTGPAHGTLALAADGSFSYTPAADFSGADQFTYQDTNGVATSNVATVALSVALVNHAPAFVVGSDQTVAENSGAHTVAPWATAISPGPANEAGQKVTFAVSGVTNPALFAVAPAVGPSGTLTYTLAPGVYGTALFMVAAHDDGGTANAGTDTSAGQSATITVTPVDRAPVAVADAFSTPTGTPLVVRPATPTSSLYFTGNSFIYAGTHTWTMADGIFTAFQPYTQANGNAVEVNFAGTESTDGWNLEFAAPLGLTLIPGTTYAGAERWPFESAGLPGLDVSGDGRGSNTVAGQFVVQQVQFNADGSVAAFAATFKHLSDGEPSEELDGSVAYDVAAPVGVLANDTDADGDRLSATLVTGTAHGKVTLAADGSFTYMPTPGFNGTDSFTYRDSDGQLTSNLATATIRVGSALAKLTGTTIGTAGSYRNSGTTISNATDGNLNTYFDGPAANGNWVGLDLGSAKSISQISFAPRAGWASRMVGGSFQVSTTVDFSSGVTTLYTITTAPAQGQLTTVALASPVTARYIRYLAPNGSSGDVAEIAFAG